MDFICKTAFSMAFTFACAILSSASRALESTEDIFLDTLRVFVLLLFMFQRTAV